MKKVRVALIGAGSMGKKYADIIVDGKVKNMELTAVVARRKEVQEWALGLVSKNGVTPVVYKDADELFANPDGYDAVLIVTPHKTHPDFANRAFKLGKHVMCDKPAGISVGQACQMADEAKKSDRIYGMMFHQRMYPKYVRIKEMLESGELGRLSRIMLVNTRYLRTAHYHSSANWRSSWNGEGGGALINQGAHILDMWQWLFGMPDRIYADIPFGKYNDFMVDDEATIQMRYADNLTAVFMLTTGEAIWEERLEIVGSRGKILLEDDELHIWHYSEDVLDYMKNQQVNSRENLTISKESIHFDKAEEPYPQMLENFAQAVIDDDSKILRASGAEAVNQMMLTNAAYYSAWRGQAVVLPLNADDYYLELQKQCEKENVLLK